MFHILFYFENESFLGIVFLWEEGIIIFVNWNSLRTIAIREFVYG